VAGSFSVFFQKVLNRVLDLFVNHTDMIENLATLVKAVYIDVEDIPDG